MSDSKFSIPVLVCVIFFLFNLKAEKPESFKISENGKAMASIIIGANASSDMYQLASELAEGLKQISGGDFVVTTDISKPGIFLGTAADWPGALAEHDPKIEDALAREDYLLKTAKDSFYIVGRTDLGTQDAVWDFFHRLGFRQFFPGKDWEIWPKNADIEVSFNESQSPSYFQRELRNGGGLDSRLSKDFLDGIEEWRKRNRMVSGFQVTASHVYGDIIKSNAEYFAQHPEDIVGTGVTAKLDPSQQGTLDAAARFALDKLKKDPTLDTVSMAPSDGRENWRKDSPLGNPSTQAITLANYVAKSIQKQYPGKKVALLAYASSTDAPDITVDKNVIVKISVYGRTGGHGVPELLKLWQAAGATVGIEDPVFSTWNDNKDLPATSRADIPYLTKSIPENYEDGARYWGGRISPAWAPYGIAYYLASRLLWDVNESKKTDAILDDFFEKSFEGAMPQMREFYAKYLFSSGHPLLSEDLMGRMYRKLSEALAQPISPSARQRIIDFIPYIRYLELYLAYVNADGKAKQDAYEALARFAKSCEKSRCYMFSHYAAINWIPAKSEGKIKPWIPSENENFDPFTEDEMLGMLQQGIANNTLVDFEPVAFSGDLEPYGGDAKQIGKPDGSFLTYGDNTFYVFADKENTELEFEITGGVRWPDRGPVKLRLFANKNVIEDQAVAEAEVPADKQPHVIKLKTPYSGLHRLEFGDSSVGGTRISWPAGQRVVIPCSAQENVRFASDIVDDTVFYVPKDTKVIGGYMEQTKGRLLSPDGKIACDFKKLNGSRYFSVKITPEQTDAWWKFEKTGKRKALLTVPPYLARSAAEGLVPKEIAP